MEDSSNKKSNSNSSPKEEKSDLKKEYKFGGIQIYSLDKIEEEILNESLYLDVFAGSDLAFKENVSPINNVLPSLVKLSCITFDYKVDEFVENNFSSERQVGLIAQEVQKEFPELVKADRAGKLYVNYSQLSTIALQGIKELAEIVADNQKRIEKLELEISKKSSNN